MKKTIAMVKGQLTFRCPGCNTTHSVDGAWKWNGDAVKVTIEPSVLVRGVVNAESDPTPTVCHSFITNGKIGFLNDCTHALAGQTVDMVPW